MHPLWIVLIAGVVLSLIGAMAYAAFGIKRTAVDTSGKTVTEADSAVLNAVVKLVDAGDIQSGIEVLQLQLKRKTPQ